MYRLKFQRARERYEQKRRSKRWILRKKRACITRRLRIQTEQLVSRRETISIIAPKDLSLLTNPNETLHYFSLCKSKLQGGANIYLDISKISSLGVEVITLLAALVNDPTFRGKGRIKGNAPDDPILGKLFCESGFYKYVRASSAMKKMQIVDSNLFHKENCHKVSPEIAKQACLHGLRHLKDEDLRNEKLYEILVEAMSNTNNHAAGEERGKEIRWWLYVYNVPNESISRYTFVDLGVGIFDSVPVSLFKKVTRSFRGNASLVPDLLAGKIKSRESVDNKMRGKGIPQIANNSREEIFSQAILISNDVRINLKDGTAYALDAKLDGTLMYFELVKTNHIA